MLRVSNDIDRYIIDDKIRISLNKKDKVVPVELSRTSIDNYSLESGFNNNGGVDSSNSFSDNLEKEITKILQNNKDM